MKSNRSARKGKCKVSQNTFIYVALSILVLLCIFLRAGHITLCDPNDRATVPQGLSNHHPLLSYYFSMPFFWLLNDAWYAPAIANIFMSCLTLILLFLIGREVVDSRFGIILAFLFTIFPINILISRLISMEMTLLFTTALVLFFFVRIEFRDRKSYLDYVLFFFTAVLSSFAKQPSLVIQAVLIFYLLIRYRLNAFRDVLLYITGLSCIPFLFYLVSRPHLLASMLIYFIQPIGQMTKLYKAWLVLGDFVIFALFYILLVLYWFFVFFSRKNRHKAFNRFVLVYFVFIMSFNTFTDHYFHLLALPVIFMSGYVLRLWWAQQKKVLLTVVAGLLILYSILCFFLAIPGMSQLTLIGCEESELELGAPFSYHLIGKADPDVNNFYIGNEDSLQDIFLGERYVILGGNVYTETKYNLRGFKLVQPSIVNSDKFNEVNYAILVFPINESFMGTRLWDYEYNSFLLDNSEVVFNGSYSTRDLTGNPKRFVILDLDDDIYDKVSENFLKGHDFREDSKKSLGVDEFFDN